MLTPLPRVWGMRHLRYLWHAYWLSRWVGAWRPYGSSHASPADLAYLDDVWEGKA